MALQEDLQWRYATKRFDSSKKVAEEDVAKIIEAARLAPTSSGLQQFRVIVVTDQALKDKITETSWGQSIISECSHLIIFAGWDRYTTERIDTMYDFITDTRELPRGRFKRYTDMLKDMYLPQSDDENFTHIARQAYIGMGLALAEAAELKVDSTPVEGFSPDKLDELLGLREKGLRSVLLMPIGYRDEKEDWLATMPKVRIPTEEFVVTL